MITSALIANGLIESPSSLKNGILSHERIVAIDGGLSYAALLNLQPNLIVGDFDSYLKEDLKQFSCVEIIELPKDKDETDLEVAIREEFKRGSQSMTLFGAWGKRIDHSLTNALILGRYPGIVRIETETEILFAISKTSQIPCFIGQTLSLIPLFGPVKDITTSGLKWELTRGKLDQNFIGISNICLKDKVTLEICEGTLLCSLLKHPSM